MKRILITASALLLLFCAALNIFAEPAALGASLAADERTSVTESYDFSTGKDDIALTPSELLSELLGEDISNEEAQYLDKKSTLKFSYSTAVPTDGVRILLPRGTSDLEAYASPYTERSTANGVSVTWTPVLASTDTAQASFTPVGESGEYLATLPTDGAGETVEISYEASFVFSAAAVNEIKTLAYRDALAAARHIKNEDEAYKAASEAYKESSALYAQYLLDLSDYESRLTLYEAYIAERDRIQAAYDKELAEYNSLMAEYEAVKAEYDLKKAEYDNAVTEYGQRREEYDNYINVTKPAYDKAYDEYLIYLDALGEYNIKREKYEQYTETAKKYNAHLDILNTAKVAMTDGRSFYDAIMGDTVKEVVRRKDEIVAAGAPAALVTQADFATNKLQKLFTRYFALTTDEDRYVFYTQYYNDFKTELAKLFRALDYFYKMKSEIVYIKLIEEEKSKKYVILLAQLYIMSTAISDEPVYNYEGTAEFTDSYTWTYSNTLAEHTIGKKYTVTPIDILEGKRYLTDTDSAAPLAASYPEAVTEPVPPEEVTKPEPPEKLTEPTPPTAPEELDPPPTAPAEPTFPEPVEEPIAPDEVDSPGEAPKPYIPTDDETLLTAALADGRLVERAASDTDTALTRRLGKAVEISPTDRAVLYFYPSEGAEEPIAVISAARGSDVSSSVEAPAKPSDEINHYSFLHWAGENGAAYDLKNVTSGHAYLYPVYKSHDRNETYTVTWNIDGKSVLDYYKYDEMPSFNGVPEKAKDEYNIYSFSSWDKELVPVRDDVTYTAIFTPTRYYKITWLVNGEVYALTECPTTDMPTPPDDPTRPDDGYGRYTFREWDRAFEPPESDTSYEAVFDVLRYYNIYWKFNGETLVTDKCLETELPTSPYTEGTVLLDDGERRCIFKSWDKLITAPSSDTSYEAIFTTLNYYTVTWMSAGEVVESKRYLEADTPLPPADPTRPDDSYGRYTFREWDKPIAPVTEDTVFEALFDVVRYRHIVWLAGGEVFAEERLLDGTVPTHPLEIPTRGDDSLFKYTFSAWDKEPAAVTEDCTYTALFLSEYIYPCGDFGALITYSYGKLTADISQCGTNEIPDLAALADLAGDRRLVIKTAAGTLTLAPDTVSAMLADGALTIAFTALPDGSCYSVEIKDGQGGVTDAEYILTAEFPKSCVPVAKNGGTVRFAERLFDGGYELREFSAGADSVAINGFKANTVYTCLEYFDISISLGTELLSLKTIAAVGERVELLLSLPEGQTLRSLYYVMDGKSEERVDISADGFVMPAGDVRLFASAKPIEFKIKFVLFDGYVIEKACAWGTSPIPPAVTDGLDESYTYTFLSWDKELTAAYADETYTAVYEKNPVDTSEYTEGSFWLLYLITVFRYRGILIASAVVSLLSVGGFIAYRKYRKKHPIS